MTSVEHQRTIALDGCFNFRDVGGYRAADGRTVRWRTLFRADGPHALTDNDAATLASLGLRTIIDLRTADEAETRGKWLDHVTGDVAYHHLAMSDALPTDDSLDGWVDSDYVGRHYEQMARRGAHSITQAVTLLSAPETRPAMFHCSAGKDRTGVLAAIVLGFLGVPDDVIVDDYAVSKDAMVRMYDWLRARVEDPEQLERYAPAVRSAEPATMRIFLDGMREQYGSFDQYAAALGLTDEVDALRDVLLEPSENA